MIGKDIESGDAVLIRRMSNPRGDIRDDDVVACMLYGDRATLKSYFRERDGIRLHPENPSPEYEERIISNRAFDIGDARIIGKMLGVWKDWE